MTYLTIQGPDFPLTFTFERRRYGSGANTQFYCWASVLNGHQSVSLGDPWPASNWPKRELMPWAMKALAGKVIVAPAICEECKWFRYHSSTCSHHRPAMEIAPGNWQSPLVGCVDYPTLAEVA